MVVTTGYGQPAYFGSKRGEVMSSDGPASPTGPEHGMSFTVSVPIPEMSSRIAVGKTMKAERYAGNSTFGDALRHKSSPYEFFL